MEGKRVLVTGGAGFIGSNLVRLLSKNNEVTVMDDLSGGNRRNLEGLDCSFEKKDIREVKSIGNDIDIVFHLAAYISVPGSVLEPEVNDGINILGTQNILSAALDARVEKLVFASSAAVYGDVPLDCLPVRENLDLRPASPYAGSKMTAEDFCLLYNDMLGLRTSVLRMFNVYGPGQDPASQYAAVIPAFITRALSGQPPIIYGDGEQTRDFVFVEDVARAFELAAATKKSDGKTMNIASGKGSSVNEIAGTIKTLAQGSLDPIYEEERSGDIRHSVASIEMVRDILGWEPKIELLEGLVRTFDWFRGTTEP